MRDRFPYYCRGCLYRDCKFITDQSVFYFVFFLFIYFCFVFFLLEQPFGRKQAQRAWRTLSLSKSFDELCFVISFIECRSLRAFGIAFVKVSSQWVKEIIQGETQLAKGWGDLLNGLAGDI